MRVRDVIRLLTDDGWFVVGRKGSHIQFKHPTKRACDHSRPPKPSLAPGTLNSTLKQAKLKK